MTNCEINKQVSGITEMLVLVETSISDCQQLQGFILPSLKHRESLASFSIISSQMSFFQAHSCGWFFSRDTIYSHYLTLLLILINKKFYIKSGSLSRTELVFFFTYFTL